MLAKGFGPIKFFFCYAREDEHLREQLEKHLSPLRRLRHITGWFDRDIQAGTNWAQEIETHLNAANIILLLISADFMHSDYCYGKEMQRALDRHKAGQAHVLPILLRPVYYEETPIGILQVLPKNGVPITRWIDQDEAFLSVVREIREILKSLIPQQTLSSEETHILYTEEEHQVRPLEGEPFQVLSAPSEVSGEPTAPPFPRMLQARYRLVSCIGQGGMGIVYKALDTRFNNHPMAIKEMNVIGLPFGFKKIIEELFEREPRIMEKLFHTGLPRVFHTFVEDERYYFAMDFIEGQTLSDYLATNASKSLPLKQVLDWGIQICDILDYLHTQQPPIVFRDLKPSNVMIHQREYDQPSSVKLGTKPGTSSWLSEVKKKLTTLAGSVSNNLPHLTEEDQKQHIYLIDFGIAYIFSLNPIPDPFPLGSHDYAAPEQYGRNLCTPRSDIYSLGVLLYQMLTGELPDRQSIPFNPASQLNTNIPSDLEQLLQQMLESDSQLRPPARDVKKMLELIDSQC